VNGLCRHCAAHEHQRCARYLATLGIGMLPAEQACRCGCHLHDGSPHLTRAAVEDMATHGTLAAYVLDRQAVDNSSLNWHFGTPCPRCADRTINTRGAQDSLF